MNRTSPQSHLGITRWHTVRSLSIPSNGDQVTQFGDPNRVPEKCSTQTKRFLAVLPQQNLSKWELNLTLTLTLSATFNNEVEVKEFALGHVTLSCVWHVHSSNCYCSAYTHSAALVNSILVRFRILTTIHHRLSYNSVYRGMV